MPTVNELLNIANVELANFLTREVFIVRDYLKDMNGIGFHAEIHYSLALCFSIILRQII